MNTLYLTLYIQIGEFFKILTGKFEFISLYTYLNLAFSENMEDKLKCQFCVQTFDSTYKFIPHVYFGHRKKVFKRATKKVKF